MDEVCCMVYNERTNRLRVYKRLLTIAYKVEQLNCVKLIAENTVVITKYIGYINSIYSMCSRVFVKFYCNIIAISRLQLINTSIDTFSKLDAFLAE